VTIRLRGVGLTHPGGFAALRELDLTIGAGERVAVIGPSGAGKTSLLRLLATALHPSTGALEIFGENPSTLGRSKLKALRTRIGLIHQSPPLPPRQRVVTAVLAGRLGRWSLPRAIASLCYPLDMAGAREALAPLDLADKLFARCDQLSGGQLQRVGIARVLYQQADLLLADEPVSAMDPVLASHTLALLNRVAVDRSLTLVASLHAVDLALAHFPRVVGVREGRIVFDRTAESVSEADLQALYQNDGLDSAPADQPSAQGQPASPWVPRCL
jgi:phosphonate transport system ATP-binding protein